MKRTLLLFSIIGLFASTAFASGPTVPGYPDLLANVALAIGVVVAIPTALRMAGVSLPTGLLMATATVLTGLNTAYDAEYKDNSKSLNDLTTKLFESAEFDKLFTVDYTDLTVWEKGVSTSGAVTQAFQPDFTPNGTFTFTPAKFPLFDIKVDVKLTSHSVKRSFIGFCHKNNLPQTAQVFVKYVMEELVAPQHIEDIELTGAWSGIRVAPTTGVSGAAIASMDGFRKYINDAVTATTIVPIAVGAAPSDPELYVAYVEEFAKSIDNKEKGTPMQLAMSLTSEEKYKEGMRLKYHTYYRDNEADKMKVYPRPLISVIGQAAMLDSDKIFCAPKFNLIKAINQGKGPLFNMEQEDRSIKAFGDYMLAYGVWNHTRFYTNDVDLS